jgi:hypothetical protein
MDYHTFSQISDSKPADTPMSMKNHFQGGCSNFEEKLDDDGSGMRTFFALIAVLKTINAPNDQCYRLRPVYLPSALEKKHQNGLPASTR